VIACGKPLGSGYYDSDDECTQTFIPGQDSNPLIAAFSRIQADLQLDSTLIVMGNYCYSENVWSYFAVTAGQKSSREKFCRTFISC
jgi:hypothetical protein